MRFLDRLKPRSITAQITGIVAISVVLGVVLVMAIVLFFLEGNPRYGLTAMAAQIGTVTRLAQASKTDDEIAAILAVARDTGIKVRRVALADLKISPQDCCQSIEALLLARRLQSRWSVDVQEVVPLPGSGPDQLAVKLDDRSALLFEAAFGFSLWTIVLAPTILTLIIVLLFVVLLSIYAVRWIISPLSAMAAAAQSFGRSPDDDRIVRRSGPREIVQVADALDDMRTRIRALLDDRTRMLAAISHDLRTPLTRLRLRAERLTDPVQREGQLHEIARITHMLDETLNYLRRDVRSESLSRIDLPSLLQTVCAEFADVGHAVAYDGPPHLTWKCRPNVLARAITNIVDNATKHGAVVTVSLRLLGERGVEIDVGDDGPGIPPALHEKVFDPFFKGDTARGADGRSGFGLGLSIARDVVRGHGGEIELLARAPHGLIVRVRLPGEAASTAETSLNIT
jgi:signal transduction histidine kinase